MSDVLQVEPASNTYEHFDQISQDYGELQFYGQSKMKWIAEQAVHYLKFKEGETIVDMGGGCGDLLNEIMKIKQVKAYCVDPSDKMLTVGRDKHHLNTSLEFVCLDMENISKFDASFDIFISCFSVHFCNQKSLEIAFKYVYKKLPPTGKILVITRHDKVQNIPLPLSVQKLWRSYNIKILEQLLREAGFQVGTEEEIYKHSLTKEQWYDHFRKRFISTFSVEAFTDGSIEEEIKKFDLVSKESDKIEFDDIIVLILGSKKSF